MQSRDTKLGRVPIPPEQLRIFSCVRPVVFQDSINGFHSLAGTGFFVKLFGEVFFVTAKHVVENRSNFDLQKLAIHYHPNCNKLVRFSDVRSYSSRDPDDTDHADIFILKADPEEFNKSFLEGDRPFDLTSKDIIIDYLPHMRLTFCGASPETSDFDYDRNFYLFDFSCGDLIYKKLSPYRNVHIANADVNEHCPNFDGLSGSPLFFFNPSYTERSRARFSGMLLRATRTSGIFRFLSAESIFNYLLGFFLDGLSRTEADAKLEGLIKWFHPDVTCQYADRMAWNKISYFWLTPFQKRLPINNRLSMN